MPRTPKPQELAAMMRLFRERKSLTTAEAGEWLGVSGRTVENIEQGRAFGNPRTMALAISLLVTQKRLCDPLD
jgi:DNA-binding XRE family transcriptional regulator